MRWGDLLVTIHRLHHPLSGPSPHAENLSINPTGTPLHIQTTGLSVNIIHIGFALAEGRGEDAPSLGPGLCYPEINISAEGGACKVSLHTSYTAQAEHCVLGGGGGADRTQGQKNLEKYSTDAAQFWYS